jgi:hypothetical protein
VTGRLARGFLAASALVVAVACTGDPPSPARGSGPNTLTGYVLVHEPASDWKVAESCAPVGPYKDVGEGTDVVVKDGSGKVIGTAELSRGQGEEDEATDKAGSETHICEFVFAVPGLVTTQTYVVQVADHPGQTVSLDNIRARFWQLFFEFPPPTPIS